jgi:hypothetical protein
MHLLADDELRALISDVSEEIDLCDKKCSYEEEIQKTIMYK